MPHPAPAHKSFADRNSLYQEITGKIIAELEQGRVPWVQPWGGVTAPLGLPRAEAVIRATGADLRIGCNRAFYVPSADYIQVPPPSAFFEPINFHRTVCHELGHWTGAAHRLNRDLSGDFGSSSYAREELCA